LPHCPRTADGPGHTIVPHRHPPVPLVSGPGRGSRPPVRPPAGPPVPRGGPGPRTADRDQLDPGGRAEPRLPALLHDRVHGREASRPHRRPPGPRGGEAAGGRCGRLTFALDDTPTPRYGPHVQGAGVHHDPSPGPAGSPFVYGHGWVVLGLLAAHPAWSVIALPLLARLSVRQKRLGGIDPRHRPPFKTKLELAVGPMR